MIGHLAGKFLGADETGALLSVNGVGYSVLAPARVTDRLAPGSDLELYIHTNLRENALELFGFASAWEKRVFLALTSISGVGPRTAIAMLNSLDAETILSSIVREDRATLTSAQGIGKKTAERLIIELGEKARKLLAERPNTRSATGLPASGKPAKKGVEVPAQGAVANSLDVTDLWNEALAALVSLGYRDADAISAIRMVSSKAEKQGDPLPTLEKLIMSSLQLMSRGVSS